MWIGLDFGCMFKIKFRVIKTLSDHNKQSFKHYPSEKFSHLLLVTWILLVQSDKFQTFFSKIPKFRTFSIFPARQIYSGKNKPILIDIFLLLK